MLTFVWCFTWERPREAWSEAALRAEAEKQVLAENFYPQRRAQLNHQAIEALGESEVLFFRFRPQRRL
jgi:hypothetical protein